MEKGLTQYQKKFRELFGDLSGTIAVRSPGRVNLIGEHTDYYEGFVLPAAVDKVILFIIAPANGTRCRLYAADLNDTFEFDTTAFERSPKGWPNYLMGVVDQLQKNGFIVGGFDCLFGGNIPIGAGMSSSAAIEGGLIYALNRIFDFGIDRLTLVKLAQRAENLFVGVNCGIMDQYINIFGEAKKVVKIDCRSLDYEYFPFERTDLRIVLCDTTVRRALATSEYNIRRKQCEEGVGILQAAYPSIRSLRDADLSMLADHERKFDPVVYRRCRYVVEENIRVSRACEDLQKNDFSSFGRRMFASHAGLSAQYEVSCRELDILVDIASGIEGVYGARMMGAGFGGCTINLVQADAVEKFSAVVRTKYTQQTGIEPKIHISSIQARTGTLVEKPQYV